MNTGLIGNYRTLALKLEEEENISDLCKLALLLVRENSRMPDGERSILLGDIVKMLGSACDNLSEDRILDFCQGGLEIGWLFNTLNLAGINSSYEFPFQEVNNYLHKKLIFERESELSLYSGALAKGMYLLSCYLLLPRNGDSENFNTILLRELLVNILDDLERILFSADGSMAEFPFACRSNEILYLILFLNKCIALKVYPEISSRLLRKTLWFFMDLVRDYPINLMAETVADMSCTSNSRLFVSTFDFNEIGEFLFFLSKKYELNRQVVDLAGLVEDWGSQFKRFMYKEMDPLNFINYAHNAEIRLSGLTMIYKPAC